MARLHWTLLFSLICHGIGVYGFLLLLCPAVRQQPVILDLTMSRLPSLTPEKTTQNESRPPALPARNGGERKRHEPARASGPERPRNSEELHPSGGSATLPQPAVSLPLTFGVLPHDPATPPTKGQTIATGSGADTGTPNGFSGGHATEAASTGVRETLQQHYLKEHFAYITALILKNLRYPPAAKRMGWSGNVVVAFVVQENGTVADVKVLKTSGYALLDTNAMETVHKVAPFPKPPIPAELRIPVRYQLDR